MTNPRVAVGVSLVGTTLAALIALYWFWNRKDEKKTKSGGLQVSKRVSSVKTEGSSSIETDFPGSSRNGPNDVSSGKSSNDVSSTRNGVDVTTRVAPLHGLTPESVMVAGAGIGTDLHLTSGTTDTSRSACLEDSLAEVHTTDDTSLRHRTIGQSQSEKLPFSNHHDNTSVSRRGGTDREIDKSRTELPLAAISNHVPEVCTPVKEKDTKSVPRGVTQTGAEPLFVSETTDAGVSRNRNVCLHVDSEWKPASSGDVSTPLGHDLKPVSENIQLKHVTAVSSCNPSLPASENLSELIQTDVETEVLSSNQLTVAVSEDSHSVKSSENIASVLLDTETTIHLTYDVTPNQLQPNLETVNFEDSVIIEDVLCMIGTESKQETEVIENLESQTQDILSKSSLLNSLPDIEYHVETSPVSDSSNINSLSSSNYKVANNNKDDNLSDVKKVNSDISVSDTSLQDSSEKKTDNSIQSSENSVKTVQVEAEECSAKGNNSGVDHQKTVSIDSASPLLLGNKSDSVPIADNNEGELESDDSTRKMLEATEKIVDSSENAGLTTESELSPGNNQEEVCDHEPSQSLSRDSLEPPGSLTGLSSGSGESLDADTVVDKSAETVPEKIETALIPQAVNGDNTSEASNDSGKGTSVGETVMLHQPLEMTICQIDFPSELCGRLIGRSGKNINYIKERTGTSITLRDNPYTEAYQLCCIEGYPSDIEEAIAMIRERFPKDRYPNLQLENTETGQESPVLLPDLQMTLPPGVSVDVIVSSVATGGLLFLQQPTHPTFPSLERLNQFMLACYSQVQSTPQLPRPVEAGVICAAPIMGGWYRAMVVELQDEDCDIKFVDYGGYCRLPVGDLRQIRSDFMTLPFQAVECYMGNLTPIQGEMSFGSECDSVLGELTEGKLLQAQIVGRATDGIPFVHIYQVSGNKVLFVNREMVNRGVAQWIEQL